jgi:beta-glucanase (GH16 family)
MITSLIRLLFPNVPLDKAAYIARWFFGLLLVTRSISAAPQWQIVWSDEFDGRQGALPDSTKWTFDLGGGGWGNHELEVYTNSPGNMSLDGKGFLVIRALKNDGRYTSARLKSAGKFSTLYGKVEARIQIPKGQGLWPALWMLGADIGQVGWPQCGEIDVMENVGKEPAVAHGTVHGPGYSGAGGISAQVTSRRGRPLAPSFTFTELNGHPARCGFCSIKTSTRK